MITLKNPANELIEIGVGDVIDTAFIMKNADMRLSQICAAYSDGNLELSYSYANDDTYQFTTYRVVLEDPSTEVLSITALYPYAFLYENEIKELFGVNVAMISLDYENKLYRIGVEAPFAKKKEVE